jgi:HSP20 family protein
MALIKWKNRDVYDPWADMRSLQDEINDLFRSDRLPGTTGLFDRSVTPVMDFIEGEDDFYLTCELPGLEEKDLDLSVASNVLTVKGTKHAENEDKKGKCYKKEIWSGSFQRTLALPQSVDGEKISAQLKNGVLKVILPKKEDVKPKQISVAIK